MVPPTSLRHLTTWRVKAPTVVFLLARLQGLQNLFHPPLVYTQNEMENPNLSQIVNRIVKNFATHPMWVDCLRSVLRLPEAGPHPCCPRVVL